jgi:hypothetical protein
VNSSAVSRELEGNTDESDTLRASTGNAGRAAWLVTTRGCKSAMSGV